MPITDLRRNSKKFLMMSADVFFVTFSLWLAFALRLSEWFWPNPNQFWIFVFTPILALPIFIAFRLYRVVVRYTGYKSMVAIFQATGLLVLLWVLGTTTIFPLYLGLEIKFQKYVVDDVMFPRSIPILFWMNLLIFIGGSRQAVRWLLSGYINPYKAKRNILIYGGGKVGMELAEALSYNRDIHVIGIIDDDHTLHGHYMQNLKVLGGRSEIEKIRAKNMPLEILLATPKTDGAQRKTLLKYLEDKKVTVRTVPSLNDIASGKIEPSDLRSVDITDLLGREAIEPDQKLLTVCVTNKTVLVTGAGGSIGSELCRQILPLSPANIVLFEHSEHNLYKLNNELIVQCDLKKYNVEITPVLGSITNKERVEETIKKFNIETIYHAAAYKHVALLENNIIEGSRNNILGTYTVAQAALGFSVKNFILISSDKAVRPTSVMGATKRIAELVIQGLSKKQTAHIMDKTKLTRFVIVRFGNVLGSSGSVVPLFQEQILAKGPITITHPEATRYFMTIKEASQLVIQAGAIGSDCNIFVLDMGEPVSILALAKQLVYLSGNILKIGDSIDNELGIEIKYTGLQKGEKIHEELFTGNNIKNTIHPKIMESIEDACEWSKIEEILVGINLLGKLSDQKMREILMHNAMKNDDIKSN